MFLPELNSEFKIFQKLILYHNLKNTGMRGEPGMEGKPGEDGLIGLQGDSGMFYSSIKNCA